MSLKRRAAKRDLNEREVIDALKAVGATVVQISETGAPDLLVGFRGQTHLLECKGMKGKLTDDQIRWHKAWEGRQVSVVRTVEEALQLIGATD
jgi:Holliday junction resolvase